MGWTNLSKTKRVGGFHKYFSEKRIKEAVFYCYTCIITREET